MKGHKGTEKSYTKTKDRTLKFYNKRAEVYWRLREALDPDQEGGSKIALPNDAELFADLTVLTYEVTPQGIKVLPKKEDLVKKLGRSPDAGDAVTIAWSKAKLEDIHTSDWREDQKSGRVRRDRPKIRVNRGNRRSRR